MVDEVDRAQELEQLQRDQALANARLPDAVAESADNCAECGYEIPSERQNAMPGTQHCVICADRIERSRPGYLSRHRG